MNIRESKAVMIWALASVAAMAASLVWTPDPCGAEVSAQPVPPGTSPASYCWFIETTITNNTGSDVTDGMFRIQKNTASFIAENKLDNLAWTIYSQQGSFQNVSVTEVQDLEEVDSGWWIEVPGVFPDGEERTVFTYFKNTKQQRDQGINFTGREEMQLPDNSLFDMADESALVVNLANTDSTARNEMILLKYITTGFQGGYALYFNENGSGGLELEVLVNGDSSNQQVTCDIDWNTAWNDEIVSVVILVDMNASGGSNDLFLFVNASTGQSQCSAAPWASQGVFPNTEPVIIGDNNGGTPLIANSDPLAKTTINSVEYWAGTEAISWISDGIKSSGVRTVFHRFDPDVMSEFTKVDPTYTGTMEATGASGVDGTYTFVRSQANFLVDSGEPMLVAAGVPAPIPSFVNDVAGTPLDDEIFSNVENPNLPFYGFLDEIVGNLTVSREAGWLLLLFVPSWLLGALTLMMFRQALAVVIMMGLPYAYGVSGGLIEEWWLLVWGLAVAGAWGVQNWERQS